MNCRPPHHSLAGLTLSAAGPFHPPGYLLVVGYGNTLRSDDGVGPRAADAIETLALPGVRSLVCPLLAPELAATVAQAHTVVFVDATVDAPREVQLRKLHPAAASQVMAHAANPATILALARDVYGSKPEAWLLTIPVENLALGEQLSPLAQSGLDFAVQWLEHFAIRRLQEFGKYELAEI
jgi:hydrogenase maturation protease